jgi:hypothetical protein
VTLAPVVVVQFSSVGGVVWSELDSDQSKIVIFEM